MYGDGTFTPMAAQVPWLMRRLFCNLSLSNMDNDLYSNTYHFTFKPFQKKWSVFQ